MPPNEPLFNRGRLGQVGYTWDILADMKVLISIDKLVLRRIDEKARALGLSRSAYLAQSVQRDTAGGTSRAQRSLARLDRLFARSPAGAATTDIRAERDER